MQAFSLHSFAGDSTQPGRGGVAVVTGFRSTTQIAQNSAGVHRCQLILVAEHDQARGRRQGFEQAGHHLQIDHRGFIDHQHIQRQQVARMMGEVTGVRPAAEQAVQG